jgi:hypothetical protein
MTPKNNKPSLNSNSSGLITWSGECIPCLDIKTGDNLNSTIYTIAEKVCELTAPLDLSTLTLQCALDIFNKEESGNRTLANVIQLLLDNDCGLKELIDGIQNQIDGLSEDNFIIDLKCLKETDSFGNALPYTIESVCQNFVNEICNLKTQVNTLSGRITTLQNQVDNLDIPSGDEVVVTTTISGPKVVSQALIDVSKSYTDFKAILGSESQIQTAIARQTSALNSLMSGVAGWITTPTTEAQSINNVWLLLSNFAPRIAANEACCASGCEDIKVGFIVTIEGHLATLSFTAGAGTFIPSGYTDNGSALTITDSLGNSSTVYVSVSQGADSDQVDLSGFKVGDVLDFNLDLKMKSATDNCQQCINKNVKYISDGCCVLTNSGSSPITIVYSTTASNSYVPAT